MLQVDALADLSGASLRRKLDLWSDEAVVDNYYGKQIYGQPVTLGMAGPILELNSSVEGYTEKYIIKRAVNSVFEFRPVSPNVPL